MQTRRKLPLKFPQAGMRIRSGSSPGPLPAASRRQQCLALISRIQIE